MCNVQDHCNLNVATIAHTNVAITAVQVNTMKAELEVLKPQLVQASKDTDELMVNVELETAEADKVKAVVSVDEASAKEEAAKVR